MYVDDFDVKTFREVKLLAQLSHPHVVRYYDNWLELKEVLPSGGDTGESADPHIHTTAEHCGYPLVMLTDNWTHDAASRRRRPNQPHLVFTR